MGRLFKISAAMAVPAVAAFFVAASVSPNANAAAFHTYDFVDYIDNVAGEHAVVSDFSITSTDTLESLTITAYGSTVDTGTGAVTSGSFVDPYNNPPYAYFDRGGAGIGVCQYASSSQCVPSNDDNITGPGHYAGDPEVLSLGFGSDGAGLADLYFRAEGHTPNGLSTSHIYVGTGTMGELSAGTIAFTLYALDEFSADDSYDGKKIGAAIGRADFGPLDIAPNEFVHIMYADEQVYLSGLETYPVPVPAALPLFLSGLAGMGVVGWRKRRANA